MHFVLSVIEIYSDSPSRDPISLKGEIPMVMLGVVILARYAGRLADAWRGIAAAGVTVVALYGPTVCMRGSS